MCQLTSGHFYPFLVNPFVSPVGLDDYLSVCVCNVSLLLCLLLQAFSVLDFLYSLIDHVIRCVSEIKCKAKVNHVCAYFCSHCTSLKLCHP